MKRIVNLSLFVVMMIAGTVVSVSQLQAKATHRQGCGSPCMQDEDCAFVIKCPNCAADQIPPVCFQTIKHE